MIQTAADEQYNIDRAGRRLPPGLHRNLTMASAFLDKLSLQTLIAPVPVAEFMARHWERDTLIIHRNTPDYYGDFFSLDDFDAALTQSPAYVKTADATKDVPPRSLQVGNAAGLDAVLGDARAGSTLILDSWNRHNAKLGTLCRVISAETGHHTQCNLYLTPANGKGFSAHWDNHDVFVLQILGSKKWTIEKDRRAFPHRDENIAKDERDMRGELHEFTLAQGDIIYIPRGFVHAAECGDEPSLHITFGVTPIAVIDVLNAVLAAGMKRDSALKAALPPGFLHNGAAPIVDIVRAAMGDLAERGFLTEVVEQLQDELVKRFPLDVAGQVLDIFRPAPLTPADHVGPRRGIVYRTHVTDDSVRINYATRAITFPGFLKEALDFALTTPSYRIEQVPGDFEPEEKVVIIERLIEEGMVARRPG